MSETTGAVRSSDSSHLDFTSMPLLGLIGVARTSSEGAAKYGRLNYMKGFSAHDILNHALRHQVMFLLGDRTEPHLEHAAWNLLAAIQALALDPELSRPNLLGPGATLTPAILKDLDANADELSLRRMAGELDGEGEWSLNEIPEVKAILAQRGWGKPDANVKQVRDDCKLEVHESEPSLDVPRNKAGKPVHFIARTDGKPVLDRPFDPMEKLVPITWPVGRHGRSSIRLVPLNIYFDGKPVADPSPYWEEVLWAVKGWSAEYALLSDYYRKRTTLLVDDYELERSFEVTEAMVEKLMLNGDFIHRKDVTGLLRGTWPSEFTKLNETCKAVNNA
jgi:hypothetical protein